MGVRRLLLILPILLTSNAAGSTTKASAGEAKPIDYQAIGRISDLKEIPPGVLDDPVKLLQHLEVNPQLKQRIAAGWFNRGVAALIILNERNQKEAKASAGGVDGKPAAPLPADGTVVTPVERYRRELVKVVSDQPWLRVQLGKDAVGRKDYRTALKDYEYAVKLGPSQPGLCSASGIRPANSATTGWRRWPQTASSSRFETQMR